MGRIALMTVCGVLLGSCCTSPAPQGSQGQDCYPNDTCNVGLTCKDGECVGPDSDCGDGVCDGDETAVSCPADCESGACGNGVIDGDVDEACDGSDLANQTCLSQGFLGGTLACASDCSNYDTRGCTSCGDSIIQIPEVCDASNFGGQTCQDAGFLSGTLTCSADCLTQVTTSCTNTCVESDCTTCINSACAQASCAAELATCDANPDCLALYQCLAGCSEAVCQSTCTATFPNGVDDYDATQLCLVCNPDVCQDECATVSTCP